jgi:NADH dehydrogenase
VVTGTFSFTGSHVARELIRLGERVRTLSRRPDGGHPLADEVEFARLQFEDDDALARDLQGARTLFNTYWVRYPRGTTTWASVLENTRTLLRAAARAGVGKVVQFSVSNASESSPYGYFRAKALAERELRESGLAYAIVRPTLVFGLGELLLSNIAWTLRRSPVFLVPTGGRYAMQPVAVEEVAELAVGLASGGDGVEIDAAGPAVYSFTELVAAVRSAIGARSRIVRCPPAAVLVAARAGSLLSGDTLVGREELAALRDDLLVSSGPPRGTARLEDWLAEHAATLGRSFVSERERNWY